MPKSNKPPFDRLGQTGYEEWPDLVTPAEVAALFRVDPKTVTRWATSGKIPKTEIVLTAGRHRRFKKPFVYQMYTGNKAPEPAAA